MSMTVVNSFTRSRIVSSEMSDPCIYLDMQSKCLEYNDNNELVRCSSVIRKLMRRVGKKQKVFAQIFKYILYKYSSNPQS